MKRFVFAVLSTTLSACAVGGTATTDVGPPPTNYREIVARAMRAEFFDPSSLQDVWIAEPYKARLFFTDGWMVCVRANGKNRMGGYTGQQPFGYLIVNAAIAQEGVQVNCPNQQFTEWKEMEGAGWTH